MSRHGRNAAGVAEVGRDPVVEEVGRDLVVAEGDGRRWEG
jgi:hypothetical protein